MGDLIGDYRFRNRRRSPASASSAATLNHRMPKPLRARKMARDRAGRNLEFRYAFWQKLKDEIG